MSAIEKNKKPAVKLQDLDSKKSTEKSKESSDDDEGDEKVIKNSADSMANDAEKLTDLIEKSMMGQDLAEKRAKDNLSDA